MSETNNRRGKRERPSPIVQWWAGHRAWVAGLDRGQRVRYRLCQVLAVIAVLAAVLVLFLRFWIRLPDIPKVPGASLNRPGDNSQTQPGQTGDISFEGAELPDVARSGRKEGYYTFLLCGRDVVSGATDTMMLVTYNTKDKTVNAISLLRDTMVNSSGKTGGQKRLNTVFARSMGDRKLPEKERIENGMNGLKQEVSRLTGIYPDFYVMVEWEAIGRLVEAIGGVYFDVPPGMDYDDPYQDLHIHQEPGYRLLNGQDAMEVIRFRKNNDESVRLGDVGRTQIQRDFLTAVLKKCLTPEILLKLPSLVQIFTENVDTDLTVGNILAFAQLAVGMDVENGVNFVPMPCYLVSYRGASLVCAQEEELLEMLNSGINPYQDEIKSSDLQLMYKKSGGGFGVTIGTLADPAVAQVSTPKPKPEEPDEPDVPDVPDTGDPDPDDPGDTSQNGDVSQPGEAVDPGQIGAIDPGDIFPDPSPDLQGGGQIEPDLEDTTQAVA